MTNFPDKLRLKERAEEDIYFARRDRELIAALHRDRRPSLVLAVVRCGGQSGVDRGVLDAVLAFSERTGIGAAGWCPRGRMAEDGVIDARYPLIETPDADPAQRTEWNVRDADATLILHRGELADGTALTQQIATRLDKPLFLIDLRLDRGGPVVAAELSAWLQREAVRVLNVAGPRESECPGIAAQASELMQSLLTTVVSNNR